MFTKQDEQALRAALRRRPRRIHEIQAFIRRRLSDRYKPRWRSPEARAIETEAVSGVARLLGQWKRQGLVDNKVRATWSWTGKP